jgi:hypothetical protein
MRTHLTRKRAVALTLGTLTALVAPLGASASATVPDGLIQCATDAKANIEFFVENGYAREPRPCKPLS